MRSIEGRAHPLEVYILYLDQGAVKITGVYSLRLETGEAGSVAATARNATGAGISVPSPLAGSVNITQAGTVKLPLSASPETQTTGRQPTVSYAINTLL
jgi:hypothetical protein